MAPRLPAGALLPGSASRGHWQGHIFSVNQVASEVRTGSPITWCASRGSGALQLMQNRSQSCCIHLAQLRQCAGSQST
jgi:hypothetical protein